MTPPDAVPIAFLLVHAFISHVENRPLPKLQRRITAFLQDQTGSISKQSIISVGSILAASTLLANFARAASNEPFPVPGMAQCEQCQSYNVGHVNQVNFQSGATLEVSHANSAPYHCSHSNCVPPNTGGGGGGGGK